MNAIIDRFDGYGNIKDTSLKSILIEYKNLNNLYPQIGHGAEGLVYKYNDATAAKIFSLLKEELLDRKFKKIEYWGKMKDESFEFPQGLVGYDNNKKAGYYMNYIETNERISTYYDLRYLKDKAKVIEYLLKAENAIKRIHNKGIIIGDIHGRNIMIDKNNNPRFVDTDNYATESFGFDYLPSLTKVYEDIFHSQCSLIDNDKFIFVLMTLHYFVNGTIINLSTSKRFFRELIEYLDVNKFSKDILTLIFSDSKDKPYIGEMLREIDPEKELIKREHVYALNRFI
ncbi:MAG: hypothetical protein PHY26_00210 [Bacilli bacterium]|nr:hypothetical protein [Bacilli bacterium]